jgi:hypothetical protein
VVVAGYDAAVDESHDGEEMVLVVDVLMEVDVVEGV